jgi:hypothetical protein
MFCGSGSRWLEFETECCLLEMKNTHLTFLLDKAIVLGESYYVQALYKSYLKNYKPYC